MIKNPPSQRKRKTNKTNTNINTQTKTLKCNPLISVIHINVPQIAILRYIVDLFEIVPRISRFFGFKNIKTK